MSGALTARVIAAWAAALPAALYDLRLVPEEGGRALLRRVDGAGLVRMVPWLRHMNRTGYHVYARPMCPRHLLVDDLGPDELDALRRDHNVAAVVETSPFNHQAWVTVTEGAIEPAIASAAARLLAARYGGDPGAAHAHQVGRLPGLANRKALHRRGDGSCPWVRLRYARASLDRAGAALLYEATPRARAAWNAPEQTQPGAWRSGPLDRALTAEWAEAARRIAAILPPGAVLDRSRVDAALARRQLRRGLPMITVEKAVLAGPKAGAMRPAQAASYTRRTVAAALARLADGGLPPSDARPDSDRGKRIAARPASAVSAPGHGWDADQ